ncbi:MAG: pantoate--beta-alanine ligase [Ilumatobacteraceae bacterium]
MSEITRHAGTVIESIAELRAIADGVRAKGGKVGFFGTNGNLHVGHLTVIRAMGDECDLTIMPLHRGQVRQVPGLLEFDLPAGYARNFENDRALAIEAGIDIIFVSHIEDMYPRLPVQVHVMPNAELMSPWENAEDPAFVRMTATAVSKYWNIVAPCRYYLGEKDWVPLTVLRRVAEDLSFRVEIVPHPVVRTESGLCASSRNAKLSPEDLATAPVIYAALREAAAAIQAGERSNEAVRGLLRERVEPVAPVDYAEVVDAYTLQRTDPLEGDLRVLVSASFSGVHLTDNIGVTVDPAGGG